MKDPIAKDATEVAYFSSWRSVPQIMKVKKHTATQVELEGFHRRFMRETGKPLGGSYADAHIENVKPHHHEQIAAAALHAGAKAVFEQVWKLQQARHNIQRDELQKLAHGREGSKVADVQAAVARLIDFAQKEFGVTIEVDVPVEKKA